MKKRIPWNKGLTANTSESLKRLAQKKSDWWKTNDTTETRKKIGLSSKTREFKRGKEHQSWKGGRFMNRGYVLVVAPEGHPNSKRGGGGKGKARYILEHRLVMENILGRYLDKTEDVHHINSNKSDNRPENLMLVSHVHHFHEHGCPKCGFKFFAK